MTNSKYYITFQNGVTMEAECFRDQLGYVYKFPYNGGNKLSVEVLNIIGAKVEVIDPPITLTKKEFIDAVMLVEKKVHEFNDERSFVVQWCEYIWERLSK